MVNVGRRCITWTIVSLRCSLSVILVVNTSQLRDLDWKHQSLQPWHVSFIFLPALMLVTPPRAPGGAVEYPELQACYLTRSVCVMWEIVTEARKRWLLFHICSSDAVWVVIYRKGLSRSRRLSSEPVLPQALPTSVLHFENTCILLLKIHFKHDTHPPWAILHLWPLFLDLDILR